MKSMLFIIILGMLFGLSACGSNDSPVQEKVQEQDQEEKQQADEETSDSNNGSGTVEVAGAEAIYQMSCSSCHGVDLGGNLGPKLQKVGSKYTEEEILSIIIKGRGIMAGGIIQGEDAKLVSAWLATMK